MKTPSIEMDHLDQIAAVSFPGYLVRKDLVRRYSQQYPVPTYVVEFLLGRYCASVDEREIQEGLEIVEKQLLRLIDGNDRIRERSRQLAQDEKKERTHGKPHAVADSLSVVV